jgi:hypothetical protein
VVVGPVVIGLQVGSELLQVVDDRLDEMAPLEPGRLQCLLGIRQLFEPSTSVS